MTPTLVQFPTGLGVPNLSPFCLKVETWLKLAGIPYEIEWQGDPRRAPLGKLPVLRDGDAVVADSSSIVAHLVRTRGVDLDARLTPPQRAVAHAFQRMLEEHLYFAVLYQRWIDPRGWSAVMPLFFGPLPAPVRRLVAGLVRRRTRRDLHGHGLGRHPPAEIWRRARQDVDALAQQLGDQPFLLGGEPASIDAVAYAFLANCWQVHIDSPLKEMVAGHPNLTAYVARMSGRCFGAAR